MNGMRGNCSLHAADGRSLSLQSRRFNAVQQREPNQDGSAGLRADSQCKTLVAAGCSAPRPRCGPARRSKSPMANFSVSSVNNNSTGLRSRMCSRCSAASGPQTQRWNLMLRRAAAVQEIGPCWILIPGSVDVDVEKRPVWVTVRGSYICKLKRANECPLSHLHRSANAPNHGSYGARLDKIHRLRPYVIGLGA